MRIVLPRIVLPLAVALVVAAVTFACDQSPTGISPASAARTAFAAAPGAKMSADAQPNMPPLPKGETALCTNLPHVKVTQEVGPEGGIINVGPHTLDIPAGALTRTVTITATSEPHRQDEHYKLSNGKDAKALIISATVRFRPHLKFETPAYLTMSYANCDIPALQALGLVSPTIVYTNPELNVILEALPTTNDPNAETATAPIKHFSTFAVAW